MTPHLAFAMNDPSQVGEARRHVARLAAELGFGDVPAGQLAIVVTELGNNLVRHARGGQLLVAAVGQGDALAIELLSVDDGPGMHDVARCLTDGFSTSSTPGSGLGAVRRLSAEFDLCSKPGEGTVILSRVRKAVGPQPLDTTRPVPAFQFAGVCLAAPGETVSGDGWTAHVDGQRCALFVADGLGHGPDAAVASDAALAIIDRHGLSDPIELIERLHAGLRSTRGAAVALLQVDAAAAGLTFCGAGNVVGRLISGSIDKSMVTQHGTAGLQVRRAQPMRYDWPEHTLIVLHSDGLASRWSLAEVPGLLRCHPAVIAGWLARRHTRGRDDVTVVVLRRA